MDMEKVKQYLRIDNDAEDDFLNILIVLSREIVENFMRWSIEEMQLELNYPIVPEGLTQARLLVIGYFYENRQGTKEQLPVAFYHLMTPYRKVVF